MSLSTQEMASGEKTARVYTTRGISYFERAEYSLALEDFRHAIELSEDQDAALYNDYAVVLYKMSDARSRAGEAINYLKRAIEIDPNYYPAINNLVKAYKDVGDTQQEDFYAAMAGSVRERIISGRKK